MILFLNFVNYSFYGGTEKWEYDIATKLSNKYKFSLLYCEDLLSKIYGYIIGTTYPQRVKLEPKDGIEIRKISLQSFFPFTKQYKLIKGIFDESKKIYLNYELTNLILYSYFTHLRRIKDTTLGLHATFYYPLETGFRQKFHNLVYCSPLFINFLSKFSNIHVFNHRDVDFLTSRGLTNITYIPHGIDFNDHKPAKSINSNKLHVIFVGELSDRKGIEILLSLIKVNNPNIFFHIVGDGDKKNELHKIKHLSNYAYYGFRKPKEVNDIYKKADVLLLPSKAESFGLVNLEAMKNGLVILSSKYANLQLPKFVELYPENYSFEDYYEMLLTLFKNKEILRKKRNDIASFCQKHFDLSNQVALFEKKVLQ